MATMEDSPSGFGDRSPKAVDTRRRKLDTADMATRSRRKTDIPLEHQDSMRKNLETWLSLWQMEDIAPRIELKLSNRMTRTIGSANLTKNRITLAAWLFNQPQLIVDEVLCHEAAHLAVGLHRLDHSAHRHGSPGVHRREGILFYI